MLSRRKSTDPWGDARTRGIASWYRDHRHVARESLAYVAGRLGTSFLVWVLIGIALALPAGLYLLERNLASLGTVWEGRPGVSIYFSRGAPREQGETLARKLRTDAAVGEVVLVSPEQALAEFREHSDVADALALLGENPLPMSLRVTPKPGTGVEALERIARDAQKAPGVKEVSLEKTWLERLTALTALVRRLGWVLAGLLGLGGVLVTATSVRLAIESRLEELKVMKLVGATYPYIRRPFLYFGVLYGVGGGLLGAMLIAAVLRVLEQPIAALVGSYGADLEVVGFTPLFLGALLGVGAVLGIGGALLAARQRLRRLPAV